METRDGREEQVIEAAVEAAGLAAHQVVGRAVVAGVPRGGIGGADEGEAFASVGRSASACLAVATARENAPAEARACCRKRRRRPMAPDDWGAGEFACDPASSAHGLPRPAPPQSGPGDDARRCRRPSK